LATSEADFAHSVTGLGRFRVNVFRQRGSVGLVFRRVLPGAPSFDALGLPPVVARLAEEPRGLVLVTGPTGSGKTTSIAAMIQHINETRAVNVVTIEDPIEFLFQDKRSIISQRLLERADGKGRVPATEVLVMTGRVYDRVVDPEFGEESIEDLIADGEYYGMQTFDQSLFNLYKNGLVSLRDAMAVASHPHD